MATSDGAQTSYEMLQLVLGKRLPAKDSIYKSGTDKSGIDYCICGYYDTLKLKVSKKWHDLRPGRCKENSAYIKNEYSIRLLRRKTEDIEFTTEKIKEYPIFACCLIHLNDECLKNKKRDEFYNKVDYLQSQLREEFKGKIIAIECFVDLGFFDIAVLMFTDHIDCVKQIVETIRSNAIENVQVSAAYTIIGYNAAKIKNCADSQISVELDIAVKEVDTLGNQEKAIRALFKNLNCKYSLMFGCYDWKCHIENCKLKDFLRFHQSNFKPTGVKRGKLRSLETHFLLNVDGGSGGSQEGYTEKELRDIDSDVYNAYNRFKRMYSNMQKNHNSHNRVTRAVYEVLALYYKVVASYHSNDVKNIVGGFIVSYLNTVTALIMHMENANKVSSMDGAKSVEIGKATQNELTIVYNGKRVRYCNYVNEIESSIGEFRNSVEPLLFDIWRAGSAYFEGQSTEHPSIGSAVKLLFAYNRTLAQLDDVYAKWYENSPKSDGNDNEEDTDFSYLVTSGGRDITVNIDLFDGNHSTLLEYRILENGDIVKSCGSEGKKISRPVLVIVPEASLYDVKGSLLRMLHEFFHKRGKRCREKRAKYYFDSLCFIAAETLRHAVTAKFVKEKARNIFTNKYYNDTSYREKNIELIRTCKAEGDDRSVYAILFEDWINKLNPNDYKDDLAGIKWFYDAIVEKCGECLDILGKQAYSILSETIDDEFLIALRRVQKTDDVKKIKWSSPIIFNSVKEVFLNGLENKETCDLIGKTIRNCFLTIESELDKIDYILPTKEEQNGDQDVQKCENNEQDGEKDIGFLKNTINAFCNGNTICTGLWIDYILRLTEKKNIGFIKFTEIGNWFKDFGDLMCLLKSLFIESYADGMAVYTQLKAKNKDTTNGADGFIDYVLTSLFELRDYKYLFNMHANGKTIGENISDIEFNGLYLQLLIAKKCMWPNCTQKEFKKNKDLIVSKINAYYRNTMYHNPTKRTANTYAGEIYKILENIIKFGEIHDDKFLSHILGYLDDCYKENEGLFDGIRDILGSNFSENEYFDFVVGKWIDIYNEGK